MNKVQKDLKKELNLKDKQTTPDKGIDIIFKIVHGVHMDWMDFRRAIMMEVIIENLNFYNGYFGHNSSSCNPPNPCGTSCIILTNIILILF